MSNLTGRCFLPSSDARSARSIRALIAVAFAALSALLLYSTGIAQAPYPRRADQQINDYASVLAEADKTAIHSVQTALLRDRGVELVVVTIASINDYDVADKTIEAFATSLFNSWGIGDQRRNDGVLLLVAVRDRKVRIEVGSGYGANYNSAMQRVIDEDMLPSFRVGKYSEGVANGVRGIQAALTTPPSQVSTFMASPHFIAGLLIVGSVVGLGTAKALLRWRRRRRNRPLRRVVMCKDCRRPMDELGAELVSADLDAGQQVEQRLRSVDYQLWECRRCGSRERRSSPGATLRYRACPKCRYRSLEEDEQVTQPPSHTRRGLKVTTRRCHYCGYSAEFKTKLAKKRAQFGRSTGWTSGASGYDTSSSSSSSYDYGSSTSSDSGTSSSDSGGSSSGDGASGSW